MKNLELFIAEIFIESTEDLNGSATYTACFMVDLTELINLTQPLTILAGPDISRESPANVSSIQTFLHAILRFGGSEQAIDGIIKDPNILYADILRKFREQYDPGLEWMEFFENFQIYNHIHQFLVKMIRSHQTVITTNFDYLIEHAFGITDHSLHPIITKSDFESIPDNIHYSYDHFYLIKLHGSLRNRITGENTRNSIITNLKDLCKEKTDSRIPLEYYKRPFIAQAAKHRTLIVIGYPEGNHINIIPTINLMQNVVRVIWIQNNPDYEAPIEYQTFFPTHEFSLDQFQSFPLEDQFLISFAQQQNIENLKITGNLGKIIENLGFPVRSSDPNLIPLDPYSFLKAKFKSNTPAQKLYFTAQLYDCSSDNQSAISFYKQALKALTYVDSVDLHFQILVDLGSSYFLADHLGTAVFYYKKALQLVSEDDSPILVSRALIGLGNVHHAFKNHTIALHYYFQALELVTLVTNHDYIGHISKNIGKVYTDLSENDKVIEFYQKSFDSFEKISDLPGMGQVTYLLADFYNQAKLVDLAIEKYQLAMDFFAKIGNLEKLLELEIKIQGFTQNEYEEKT